MSVFSGAPRRVGAVSGAYTGDGTTPRTLASTNPDGAGVGPDVPLPDLVADPPKLALFYNAGDGAPPTNAVYYRSDQLANSPVGIAIREGVGVELGLVFTSSGFRLSSTIAGVLNQTGATMAYTFIFT